MIKMCHLSSFVQFVGNLKKFILNEFFTDDFIGRNKRSGLVPLLLNFFGAHTHII